mgnify:CR=1 FL=1
MKVILLENIKKIGSIGEIIDVKRGFARNFLIANKKALYASKENIKEFYKKNHIEYELFDFFAISSFTEPEPNEETYSAFPSTRPKTGDTTWVA